MARIDRHKKHTLGAYYHIFNRGIDKQNIFFDESDYIYYLKLIRILKEKFRITFICYVFMKNHFHFLLRQDSGIPVSKFMQSLNSKYVNYLNNKYNRVGPLFQGRYKQRNVEREDYLLWLSCYIHVNPKIGRLVNNIDDWVWSSYPDYIGTREGTLCDKNIISELLGRDVSYKDYVLESYDMIKENKELRKYLFD